MSERKCGVNDALGGGIFICRRPVATTNGFCDFHAQQDARTLELELTWRAWLKKYFVYTPRNIWRAIRLTPSRIRSWWWLRRYPFCEVAGCEERSFSIHGGPCVDHFPEE